MSKLITQPLSSANRQQLIQFLRRMLTEIEGEAANSSPKHDQYLLQQVQYLTNEAGDWLGVLWPSALAQTMPSTDPDLLLGLSQAELQALSNSKLAVTTQTHLTKLLAQNREGMLSDDETKELDQLLDQIDHLNILKARAIYTLHQQILVNEWEPSFKG